mmetsp:Transcript_38634/g.58797  ORF Transcript_38634/g.58797 Transcript_38634/m.58797 type:complete len:389 (+) Transcript_38634:18-1184(+)
MKHATAAVPEGYKVLTEGQAKILYKEQKLEKDADGYIKAPKKTKKQANEINETRGAVFYNPVQEFNRDISIAVIREYIKVFTEEREAKGKTVDGISVLEALAATGLRSVRYLKEIPKIRKLVANDLDPAAVDLMTKNFEFNSIDPTKYETQTEDAVWLMQKKKHEKEYFDIIDLDPYGTAIPFLDSSIANLYNGGMLCVTFTDTAVLCARQPHVCFYKYGSAPLPNRYTHEMALRNVLHMINEMANRHGRYIEPLLSLTVDFYVRLFIRVRNGLQECQKSIVKYSSVYQCVDCEAHYFQPLGREVAQIFSTDKKTGRKKKYKLRSKAGKDGKESAGEESDHAEEIKEHDAKHGTTSKFQTKIGNGMVEVPSSCEVCDGRLTIGGPIWN